jgi:RNA polymerase sigma factor (sigma-70 family)
MVPKKVLCKEPKRTVCTPCRDKLILQYLKMAYLFANREWLRNRLFRRRLERDDLSQIALLALTKCAARYDPGKGKLSTILPYWVKAEMQSEVIHHGGAVCLPLWATRGGTIADHKLKRAMANRVDLEDVPSRVLSTDSCHHMNDADEPPSLIHKLAEHELLRGTSTNDLEKHVVILNVVNGKSNKSIGESLGRTKEGIRQIKNRALRKIKESIENQGLSA